MDRGSNRRFLFMLTLQLTDIFYQAFGTLVLIGGFDFEFYFMAVTYLLRSVLCLGM